MVSNLKKNKQYIWIGTWSKPNIELVYYLKPINPQIAITTNLDKLTNPNFDRIASIRHLWECVWAHELYEYTPKLFKKLQKKINFLRKREKELKKFEIPFSEIYEIFVEDIEKNFISLLCFYYRIKILNIFTYYYAHWIYPIFNIYTHDIQTIFTYSPKLIESRKIINKKKIELENTKSDWIYNSVREKEDASNLLKAEIKTSNEELQSSIKLLNDASRTLVSASIAFLALLFSIISFNFLLSENKAEIDNYKKDISNLNSKIDTITEQKMKIEFENMLLKNEIQKKTK